METTDLKKLASILRQSNQYRVAEKYQKPEYYNVADDSDKLIGVFLDVETTGLSHTTDKIIELGMVKFEYTQDGRIFRVLDEFTGYQDPGLPIPEAITKLTGITDDMVKGHRINVNAVAAYLNDVNIIITHNAQFDRTFFEMTFPVIAPKPWGCLMDDINWKNEGISSRGLEYIAYKYNFFFEGHRAIIDCLVGIHILAQDLPISKELVLKRILTNSEALKFKLWATNSPYDRKDLLKARGYRWNMNQSDKHRAWSIELKEDKVAEEINYLRSEIYGCPINIPVEVFDAYNRFSSRSEQLQNSTKYQGKLEWVKMLCIK